MMAGRIANRVLRPDVEGPRPEATGPLLLAANHLASIDRLTVQTGLGRPVSEANVDSVAGLHEARERLDAGEAVLVFPEGGVSPDGQIHRGRIGLAELVVASGLPVTPLAVIGTNQPIRHLAPWATERVRVVVGDPHDFGRFAEVTRDAAVLQTIVDEVMHAIVRLSQLGYVDQDVSERAEQLRQQHRADQIAQRTQRIADREARKAAEAQAKAEAAAEAAQFAAMQAQAEEAAREQARRAAEQDEVQRAVRARRLPPPPAAGQRDVRDPRLVRPDNAAADSPSSATTPSFVFFED